MGESFQLKVASGEASELALKRATWALYKLGVPSNLLRECSLLKELIPFSEVQTSDRHRLFYLQVKDILKIN